MPVYAPPSATAVGAPASCVADTLWLFAADPARDAVHASDDEAALVRRYGRANVRRDSIPGAEWQKVFGTILFPDDPTRTAYVYWDDDPPFARAGAVRTGGSATAWVVWPGVALGTPLGAVERLNGRPFRLYGFYWEFGGEVVDWRGGRLETAWNEARPGGRHVIATFVPHGPALEVSGEGTFSSARRAMRRADVRVGELYVGTR